MQPARPFRHAWRVTAVRELENARQQSGAGRWHDDGQELVYASSTPELAVLEALAHLHENPRRRHWMCRLELPPRHAALAVPVTDLDHGWQRRPRQTRALGAAWLRSGASLALHVPSALVSEGTNVLLNPDHAKGPQVCCEVLTAFVFDARFRPLRRPRD